MKGSSSANPHPASSHATVIAMLSWYPKFPWHVVNRRSAFLFNFEL